MRQALCTGPRTIELPEGVSRSPGPVLTIASS